MLTHEQCWPCLILAPASAEENIEEFLPGTTLPGNAIDPSNTTAAAVAALRDTLTDEADPSSEADHFYGINGARQTRKLPLSLKTL